MHLRRNSAPKRHLTSCVDCWVILLLESLAVETHIICPYLPAGGVHEAATRNIRVRLQQNDY
jgi:hypothetical protein